jgi:hypothetical protein
LHGRKKERERERGGDLSNNIGVCAVVKVREKERERGRERGGTENIPSDGIRVRERERGAGG